MSIEANEFEFHSNIQRVQKFGEPINEALRNSEMQTESVTCLLSYSYGSNL
jgi:hypothetical protein